MAKRDPWPGVSDVGAPTKYDDIYYQSHEDYWETVYSWDNDFKGHILVVHPVYGHFKVPDTGNAQKLITMLVQQANGMKGKL